MDIFKVSNTGRTITISVPLSAGPQSRYAISFADGWITLRPDPKGKKISVSNNCITFEPQQIPSWPTHGRVDIVGSVDGNGVWTMRLPADLPKAKRIVRGVNAKKPEPKEAPQATPPTISLRAAVAAINEHKRIMGDDLVLDVRDGELRAMLEYK